MPNNRTTVVPGPVTLLAACLLLGGPACAQDATIEKVSGRVSIRAEGEERWLRAKAGDALIIGDSVKTSAHAAAQVVIGKAKAAVLLAENTQFTLRGEPDNEIVDFTVGEFLIGLFKKLKASQSFKASTPAAVASVRGTLFWGKTDESANATFAGFGHIVEVSAQGKTVTVQAGQLTTVAKGRAPTDAAPHQVPLDYLKNFAVEGGLQGVDALIDPALKPRP